MKSRVILLPCREYDEEKIHNLLKQGLELMGGLQALIDKNEKILFGFISVALSSILLLS